MAMSVAGGGHGGGGRRRRGVPRYGAMAEINMTPFIDVMLVLLIIFMVAAPMLQRGVEGNLPVASRSQEIASDRVFVSVPLSYRQDHRVFSGKEGVRVDVLTERMRQMMTTRTDKQVFLRGDGGIQLQDLLDVMDRLKAGLVDQKHRQETIRRLFNDAGCEATDQRVNRSGGNVVCTLPGEVEGTIVVGGHFDFVTRGKGIVDDWSGASCCPRSSKA